MKDKSSLVQNKSKSNLRISQMDRRILIHALSDFLSTYRALIQRNEHSYEIIQEWQRLYRRAERLRTKILHVRPRRRHPLRIPIFVGRKYSARARYELQRVAFETSHRSGPCGMIVFSTRALQPVNRLFMRLADEEQSINKS